MRRYLLSLTIAFLALSTSSFAAKQDDAGKINSIFQEDANCAFFIINEVNQANPVVPGSPVFAAPKSDVSHAEMYSIAINKYANNKTIYVINSGSIYFYSAIAFHIRANP
jgi:hypothetical protein